MKEIWKDIEGYDGVYQVSNLGRVKSNNRRVYNYIKPGRILKPHSKPNGYLHVALCAGNRHEKHAYIHRLVAKTFIPNPNNLPQINHKDFNKKNNVPSNLEWVTARENQLHYRKSLRRADKNIKPKSASKFVNQVLGLRKNVISLYEKGFTYSEIGKEVNIGKDFVASILLLYDKI